MHKFVLFYISIFYVYHKYFLHLLFSQKRNKLVVVGGLPVFFLLQILSMIPKESDGECFQDALARVCRCIGGGNTADNADDSDSDLEVVADFFGVNLRCPVSLMPCTEIY